MKPDDAGLSVFQTQYVLHIVQAFCRLPKLQRAYSAGGKGHAAAGFVGDFHALAVGG